MAHKQRLLLTLFLIAGSALAQRTGEPLPPWTEGTLDIHHINTGKGNSTLFVLPDGTSMLLDAGWGGREGPRGVPARPDNSRNPGEWIARYARAVLKAVQPEPAIDYALLTHFHGDHMGSLYPNAKASRSGAYKLTGVTEVGEQLPIRRILDRGWPGYDFPRPSRDPMIANYRAFLRWQSDNNGLQAARFQPGRNDQIVLLRAPARYPNFEIRNVLANTEVWTGVGANTRRNWPDFAGLKPEELPSENPCSLGFRLSYGKFDYGTFGDIPGNVPEGGPVWHDMETPVARAVGPVEALILDHHGNRDSTNAFLVSSLRPRVFIIPVWSSDHPGHDVLSRMYSRRLYPGPRDVFATNMAQANRDVIGPLLDRLKSAQGHILLRVAPNGESFHVIILDDSAETFRVTAIFGPYLSR